MVPANDPGAFCKVASGFQAIFAQHRPCTDSHLASFNPSGLGGRVQAVAYAQGDAFPASESRLAAASPAAGSGAFLIHDADRLVAGHRVAAPESVRFAINRRSPKEMLSRNGSLEGVGFGGKLDVPCGNIDHAFDKKLWFNDNASALRSALDSIRRTRNVYLWECRSPEIAQEG